MEKLKHLDSVLFPLQIFGLKFFTVNSINQFAVKSEIFDKKFILIFMITFPSYTVISSYYYIYGFMHFEDVASSHNFLQYELKIITYGGRLLIIVVAILEGFCRTAKIREVWTKSWKITKILNREFRVKFDRKFQNCRAILKRRLVFLFLGLVIVEIFPQFSKDITPHSAVMCVTKLLGSTIISLMFFKHCFYVDFVNLHIHILDEILSSAFDPVTSQNLRKIITIQKCYIEIIEMATLVNESVTF